MCALGDSGCRWTKGYVGVEGGCREAAAETVEETRWKEKRKKKKIDGDFPWMARAAGMRREGGLEVVRGVGRGRRVDDGKRMRERNAL